MLISEKYFLIMDGILDKTYADGRKKKKSKV